MRIDSEIPDTDYEIMLGILFSNNRNLRSLQLSYMDGQSNIDFLLKLPLDQMTKIDVGLRGKNLVNILQRTTNLSEFYYRFNEPSEMMILNSISSHLTNLTKLKLYSYIFYFEIFNIDQMLSLVFKSNRQLKSLTLRTFQSFCFGITVVIILPLFLNVSVCAQNLKNLIFVRLNTLQITNW